MKSTVFLICVGLCFFVSVASGTAFEYAEKAPSSPKEHLKVIQKNIKMLEQMLENSDPGSKMHADFERELERNRKSIPYLEHKVKLEAKMERQNAEMKASGTEDNLVHGMTPEEFAKHAAEHWAQRDDKPWAGKYTPTRDL